MTNALCNIELPDNKSDVFLCYPIERMIRLMAKIDSVYVMAVLDCCRTDVGKKDGSGS